MIAPFIIPTFDPDSADSTILEAQDEVHRQRAWVYSFDGKPDAPEEEIAASDERIIAVEDQIHDNHASTIPGIIARLQTLLTRECDRWIDRAMSEGGFIAVYRRIKELNGDQRQMVHAIHELYHFDWEQALAAYERAEADLTKAGAARAVTDPVALEARARGEHEGPAVNADDATEQVQNHMIDRSGVALNALLRTIAPDHDAYLRKMKIMAAEGIDYALPWLARDTAFLIGRLYAAAPEGAR
ncbi:hypothetical protein [Sphingomonas sp. Leaf242]|uniref:hypothetical protein n=1 Tax=Sphingomonas sp. Leaf242 TaxID=1736304 RepID=UPI0007122DE2|nr:hypothetical protein [Sphingomonas sp. Leaf242]KQO13259.1 hypothetical protein ASF09_03145 [Sphingomonas sp. Leaf242]